ERLYRLALLALGEDVDRLVGHPDMVEDLDGGGREAAHRKAGGPLHVDDHGVLAPLERRVDEAMLLDEPPARELARHHLHLEMVTRPRGIDRAHTRAGKRGGDRVLDLLGTGHAFRVHPRWSWGKRRRARASRSR